MNYSGGGSFPNGELQMKKGPAVAAAGNGGFRTAMTTDNSSKRRGANVNSGCPQSADEERHQQRKAMAGKGSNGGLGRQRARGTVVRQCGTGRSGHPHYCLFGWLHLLTGLKLVIAIGTLAWVALCVLEALYFRRALILMCLPAVVSLFSVLALCKKNARLLWPIIGISFFHLFLDAYATIIFLFFFLFKPLYIIMVLNWAFDTMHTTKTPSYYVHCATVFSLLVLFFLFNLWQLNVSLRCQNYLEELLGSGSSSTASTGTASSSNNGSVGMTREKMCNGGETNHIFVGERTRNGGGNGVTMATIQHRPPPHQQQQCKILNEPPIILVGNGGNFPPPAMGCPSPASQRGNQVRLGPRRASLTEQRQFGAK